MPPSHQLLAAMVKKYGSEPSPLHSVQGLLIVIHRVQGEWTCGLPSLVSAATPPTQGEHEHMIYVCPHISHAQQKALGAETKLDETIYLKSIASICLALLPCVFYSVCLAPIERSNRSSTPLYPKTMMIWWMLFNRAHAQQRHPQCHSCVAPAPMNNVWALLMVH